MSDYHFIHFNLRLFTQNVFRFPCIFERGGIRAEVLNFKFLISNNKIRLQKLKSMKSYYTVWNGSIDSNYSKGGGGIHIFFTFKIKNTKNFLHDDWENIINKLVITISIKTAMRIENAVRFWVVRMRITKNSHEWIILSL